MIIETVDEIQKKSAESANTSKPDVTVKRQRKSHTKDHSGCKTCRSRTNYCHRSRHIKCGLERPHCLKCVRSGRICDGYELKPKQWTIKSYQNTSLSASSSSSPSSASISRSPSTSPFTAGQSRGLEFYLAKTARHLGYSDHEFWNKWLPQIAHDQDCVRHGLLALSGVYEEFMYSTPRPSALKNYNLAIRSALKTPGMPLCTALITCLLFITTEMIQGHQASAIQLLGHARALLRSLQNSDGKTETPKEILAALRSLFIDLEYNFWAFCRTMLCEFDTSYAQSYDVQLRGPSPVLKFGKLDAAARSLHNLHQEWMGEFYCGCQNIDHLAFYTELQQWKAFFEPLRACKYEKPDDQRTMAELEISWRQIEAAIFRFVSLIGQEHLLYKWQFIDQDEDSREEIRAQMLDHAEEAMKVPGGEVAPTFGLGSGMMLQMYMVAINCRDPQIRRKAVRIIRSCKRQEGLLKNEVLATVAERTIELEEQEAMILGGLYEIRQSADVITPARVRHRNMKFSSTSSGIEWCYSLGGVDYVEVVA